MPKLTSAAALVVVAAAAFSAGIVVSARETLAAQDRGPQRPKPSPSPGRDATKTAAPLVWGGDGGSAASANGMIAVTGSYGVGTSVLFVIDTQSRQLAVYEARGGSPDSAKLFLVGARRIDLDLQLQGYNDLSEFPYERLQGMFERRGDAPARPDDPTIHPIPAEGKR